MPGSVRGTGETVVNKRNVSFALVRLMVYYWKRWLNMILVKCFARGLVQEAMRVHTQGNLPVKWVAWERRNELDTRPV